MDQDHLPEPERDEDLMGDQVYQPDGSQEQQDDIGVLEPADTLDDRGVDPALDEGYSPPEHPLGVERSGTTAAEQREGESLDQRLAQELPDVGVPSAAGIGDPADSTGESAGSEVGATRSGRLVADDDHNDLQAEDSGIAGGAAGAEEAAVHTFDPLEAQRSETD